MNIVAVKTKSVQGEDGKRTRVYSHASSSVRLHIGTMVLKAKF